MPSALSVDLRERVIAAIETGTSRRQAAKRFGVGAAKVRRGPKRIIFLGIRAGIEITVTPEVSPVHPLFMAGRSVSGMVQNINEIDVLTSV